MKPIAPLTEAECAGISAAFERMNTWPRPVSIARALQYWSGLSTERRREAISIIADILIAYGHGRLRPVDAETETHLLDSMDKAFDAAPALMTMLAGLGRQDPRS